MNSVVSALSRPSSRLWCLLLVMVMATVSRPALAEDLCDLRGPMPAPGTVIKQQTFLIMDKGDLIARKVKYVTTTQME